MVASLEQLLDLKTASFENVIGCLKTYEERVSEEEEDAQDQNKLMYTNSESQPYRDYQGGLGRGGRNYNRGRGRGRTYWDNRDNTRSYWESRDNSKVTCFRCDKQGHFAATCPDRQLKLQEATESKDGDMTQEADRLMMQEIVYLNERNVTPKNFESNTDSDRIWY